MTTTPIRTLQPPTGVANTDTLALQSLIDSLPNGGIIQFRAGTYVLGQILVPSNIAFHGGKIVAKAALNTDLFRNNSVNNGNANIKFIDMEIDGNAAQQTDLANPCHAIALYYCNDCLVDHCNIYNTEMDGVYLGRNGVVSGVTVGGHNARVRIVNSRFTDIRRNGISVTRGHDILIERNRFINNNVGYREGNAGYNAGAVDLEGNAGTDVVENIVINNNYFENYASASIQVASGHTVTRNVSIVNNLIRQTTRFGITLFSQSENIEVAHNRIYCVDAHGIWSNAFEQAEISTDLYIHNNYVFGDDTSVYGGISFNYSQGIVENNHILNFNRGLGAYFYTTATYRNNEITSCANSVVTGGAGVSLIQEGNVVN